MLFVDWNGLTMTVAIAGFATVAAAKSPPAVLVCPVAFVYQAA